MHLGLGTARDRPRLGRLREQEVGGRAEMPRMRQLSRAERRLRDRTIARDVLVVSGIVLLVIASLFALWFMRELVFWRRSPVSPRAASCSESWARSSRYR